MALKGYNVYEWVSGRDRDGNYQISSSRRLRCHGNYVRAVPLRRDGRISHCFVWGGAVMSTTRIFSERGAAEKHASVRLRYNAI